jgi:prepilin peptidase CpaA
MDPFFPIRLLLLLSVAGFSAISDFRTHTIPNVMLLTFLGLALIAWVAGRGVEGLYLCLAPAVLVLMGLMPVFCIRALAGGDVKLFATIAGIAGAKLFAPILILSLIAGGISGVVVWCRRFFSFHFPESMTMLRCGPHISDNRFPFAFSIFMGTVLGLMVDSEVMAWILLRSQEWAEQG